ncbi:MAG: NADH-quinone oxidoreductase subunit L [Alphaproteobacteria bacterium]|nr:NADH-quinone oxidoreductase subunit L [Alphaproteobacteria bacterium]
MDIAAVFLPFLGAVAAGLFGRRIGDRMSQAVTCGCVFLSACLSVLIFKGVLEGETSNHVLLEWIQSGGLSANWGIKIDTLSAVMLVVVNVVSAMVHFYSIGYMSEDKSKPRFMAYLSLFTFFMSMLVTAPNLLQMFFGWEGVGLMSYLLIGFWYEKPSANDASMKAFLVNRVGDFGFLLGIFGCFMLFGSLDFGPIFEKAPEMADKTIVFFGHTFPALTAVCLLLFMGAMGKSAQLGLHTWLPDAMEGPTPVSALIHAATMVTAGVFMVARMSPVFEYAPGALAFVAIIGGLTCVFAASIGLTQFDIKRVIAYSTMSQLGYMFFAAGVSAYSASIFHLMTHAFFKALLFLCAGSVIHALSGEQDMRKMGGLWRIVPKTYALMWIGFLALAGIGVGGIGFAGYYSKDLILEAALGQGTAIGCFVYVLGALAAFMTAFYSGRLLFMTFHGEPREERHMLEHAHESSWVMLAPLVPLALGAIFAGGFAFDLFGGDARAAFWNGAIFVLPEHDSLSKAEHVGSLLKALPVMLAFGGLALSWLFYVARPEFPAIVSTAFGAFYRFVCRKFYFDDLYDFIFVRGARKLGGAFWRLGDDAIIDGCGPDGFAKASLRIARRVSALQSGYVYHYAFAMILGVTGLVTWFWYNG